MRRAALVVSAMLGLPSFIFFIVVIVPTVLTNQPRLSPEQPIAFDHSVHVETAGIDCTFCHRTASRGMTAGYPEVQQCMFCHQVLTGDQHAHHPQEIAKVRDAWAQQRPIDWTRVHRMPDHVRFVHEAHIQAGYQCATCHGDVGKMAQVVQVRTLNMGDCLTCHRQAGASTECATCHK